MKLMNLSVLSWKFFYQRYANCTQFSWWKQTVGGGFKFVLVEFLPPKNGEKMIQCDLRIFIQRFGSTTSSL